MFTHRSQLADCVQRPVQEQLITIQSYIHKDNDYSLHRNSILVWYRQTIEFMWARLQWRIIGQKPFNKLPLLKSRATWNVGMFPNTGCNQTWMMNIIWLEILVYSYYFKRIMSGVRLCRFLSMTILYVVTDIFMKIFHFSQKHTAYTQHDGWEPCWGFLLKVMLM